jgi:plastocyanin
VIAIIIIAAIVVVFVLPGMNPSPQPNVEIHLYGDEISGAKFGFGFSPDSVTSPGPTLNFTVGDVVKVTFHNIGAFLHNFAIVSELSSDAPVLFNSQIASASNPVTAGGSGSVIFTVNQAGNFYYICQVSGHVALGMYGNVTVTQD